MRKNKIVINADDFGMTAGTCQAILSGHDEGVINSTSCMTNGDFFPIYAEELKKRPLLKKGVHLNLTYGRSLSGAGSLIDSRRGFFKNGFFALVFKSFFDKKFLADVEREWREQIGMLTSSGIRIAHIDSHRHVHMIPPLFKIAVSLSRECGEVRIRNINESLFASIAMFRSFNFLLNGGIVKFFLLRFFSRINKRVDNSYQDWDFFSILYTGAINEAFLRKIFNQNNSKGRNIEIMVHPNLTKIDEFSTMHSESEKAYRLSPDRDVEYRALVNVALSESCIS